MDWTQIIVAAISAVAGLLTGGGLMMWFTRKETKEGKALENMQKVLDSMQNTLNAKDRIIQEHELRRNELKADIDKKDDKIETLLKEKSVIRDANDDLKTSLAVANLMKCIKLKCYDRDPPFGSVINLSVLKDTDLEALAK